MGWLGRIIYYHIIFQVIRSGWLFPLYYWFLKSSAICNPLLGTGIFQGIAQSAIYCFGHTVAAGPLTHPAISTEDTSHDVCKDAVSTPEHAYSSGYQFSEITSPLSIQPTLPDLYIGQEISLSVLWVLCQKFFVWDFGI